MKSADGRRFDGTPVRGDGRPFSIGQPVPVGAELDSIEQIQRLICELADRCQYLVIRNADTSFVYFSAPDGVFPAVPAEDREGNPHDFSLSARLAGAREIDLVGQGAFDDVLGTAHLGILNSPVTWQRAFDFLSEGGRRP